MEIRLADEGDVDRLVYIQRQTQDLHQRSFPSYYRSPADDDLQRAMREFLAAEEMTFVWIALVEEVPVGFLVLKLIAEEENAFCHARHEALIDQLAVAAEHRRAGIGRALVERAQAVCPRPRCTELRLAVLVTNETARQFYRTLGLAPFIERWRKEL